MKTIYLIIVLTFQVTSNFAQNDWFKLYSDELSITKDADRIARLFDEDVKKVYPDLGYSPRVELKTSPLLIYYGKDKIAYYPLWSEVPKELQNWFYEIGGSETDGKRIFALFFNGFYLPHELAHGFEDAMNNFKPSYHNEYFANKAAILWWRKHGYDEQLKECYEYSKKILAKTPNPAPEGQTAEDFFTENYYAILESGNPYTYGYMQFNQFVEIYEDQSLVDFDDFIGNYRVKN